MTSNRCVETGNNYTLATVQETTIARNACFALFSLVLALTMWKPIGALAHFALDYSNSAASHIVAVPFIAASLIYLNRADIFRNIRYSVLPGAMIFAAGAGLFIVAAAYSVRLDQNDRLALQISSTVVLWLGGFLFFYGDSVFRTALFPLMFLLLCIPIPTALLDTIVAFMQYRSADMAYVLLKLTGTPIHREGVIFALPDLFIVVAPECSGIRSGISILISSLVAGYVLLRSPWRRIALLAGAIPILIFKNALRIGVLTYLAIHVDKRILTSELHREGGIPFFVLGLILVSPFLFMLMKGEKKYAKAVFRLAPIQRTAPRP